MFEKHKAVCALVSLNLNAKNTTTNKSQIYSEGLTQKCTDQSTDICLLHRLGTY